MAQTKHPDFRKYHESIASEIHSLKDRVRDLTTHWLTDGELKESVLRTILRRHLPENLLVGRGFIVSEHESSTQLDILVIDSSKPTLFKDDSLFIVTPDAVKAVIEVKTKLATARAYTECATKLARAGELCNESASGSPWLGIFCYEKSLKGPRRLLKGLNVAYGNHRVPINCVSYGKSRFVRFWAKGSLEPGDGEKQRELDRWRCYYLQDLAPAYFVANLVDAMSKLNDRYSSFAWFPISGGKKPSMIEERVIAKK